MALALPFTITGPAVDPDAVQGNFDALKKEFPLGRKHMKIEVPNAIGATTQPAFENGWANFAGYQVARFWKDPMDLIHLEGVIALGTVGAAAFTLPAGYRPGIAVMFGTISNSTIGRIDINILGQVVPLSPSSNVWVSLNGLSFKQER